MIGSASARHESPKSNEARPSARRWRSGWRWGSRSSGRWRSPSPGRSANPATAPRDAGHLEIQEFLLAQAAKLGRPGTFELPTRPTDPSRSSDVGIRDPSHGVRILAECWNTFGDIGAAARATTRKAAEAAAAWPDDRIATVWVVRATAANRALLARYPSILDAAFPGSSRAWVAALTMGTTPPADPGFVWFDAATGRLTERRRSTI